MNILRAAIFMAAAMLITPALAQDFIAGDAGVDNAWARATPGRAANGAAYMTLSVSGDQADRLISASSPVAERAEFHTNLREGEVIKMRSMAAIDVLPGAPVMLQPGGHHLMLIGLAKPLKAGQRFPLTLTFERAGILKVEVEVKPVRASAENKHESEHGAHEHGADIAVDGDGQGLTLHSGHEAGHAHGPEAPVGIMGGHMHGAGQWMVSYRFMRMLMEGTRDGSDDLSLEQIATTVSNRFSNVAGQPPTLRVVPTKMSMDMHMFGAMYAPTDWITLMAMGMHQKKEMDHVTFAGAAGTTRLGEFTTETEGWSDTKLSALVRLYDNGRHHLHANTGVSLPTGSVDEEDDVLAPNGTRSILRVPYPMQLGSGTYDALPGLTYTASWDDLGWGAQYGAVIRLGDNHDGYSLGDEHRLTAWTAYQLQPWVSASLRVAGQSIGKIDGIDPNIVAPVQTADPDNQGGERIDLALGVAFSGLSKHSLEGHRLAVELGTPVYQDLNGPQLKTDMTLAFRYQFTF